MQYLLTEEELKALTDGHTQESINKLQEEIKQLKKELKQFLTPMSAQVGGFISSDPLSNERGIKLSYNLSNFSKPMQITLKNLIRVR